MCCRLVEREVELTKVDQEPETRHIRIAVLAVIVRRSCGGRHEPASLVETDGVDGRAESPGEGSDAHDDTLDLRAALMSRAMIDHLAGARTTPRTTVPPSPDLVMRAAAERPGRDVPVDPSDPSAGRSPGKELGAVILMHSGGNPGWINRPPSLSGWA